MAEGEEHMDQGPIENDQPDARFFSSGSKAAGDKPVAAVKPMSEAGVAAAHDSIFHYNMHHPRRGLFIVINNMEFDASTGMTKRQGSDRDAAGLYASFKKIGFQMHVFNNQKVSEMIRVMHEAAKENHSDADCFACAILSHGEEGRVYGTDGTVLLETLMSPFKGCESLLGKPKIFFIQACRGSKFDEGVEVADSDVADAGPPDVHRIPVEADFLMSYSTVPGYYSWRNSTRGSWFVQSLCKALADYSDREIVWILTRVNYLVAYEFESNASSPSMNKKKQIPCITSMLTKELHFHPKKN